MAVFLPVVTVYGSTALWAGPVEEAHFFSFQTPCLMLIPFVLKGFTTPAPRTAEFVEETVNHTDRG